MTKFKFVNVIDLLNDVKDRNGRDYRDVVESVIEQAYTDGFEAGLRQGRDEVEEAVQLRKLPRKPPVTLVAQAA